VCVFLNLSTTRLFHTQCHARTGFTGIPDQGEIVSGDWLDAGDIGSSTRNYINLPIHYHYYPTGVPSVSPSGGIAGGPGGKHAH
jgi:hypothetical protein